MGETKKMLKELSESLNKLGGAVPEQMKGFMEMLEAIEKPGALDSKTKELIALSIAVKAQCSWCIAYHVNGCLEKGATKEEVIEAGMMAVLMGGGPALMYMKLVQDALEDLGQ